MSYFIRSAAESQSDAELDAAGDIVGGVPATPLDPSKM
jgi:hypothetical protein